MSIISDVKILLDETKKYAEKIKNQDIVNNLLKIQLKFYEMKEEIENLKNELNNKIKIEDLENDINVNTNGTVTKTSENNKILYCGTCWASKKILVPLVKHPYKGIIYKYCNNCKSEIQFGGLF